MYECCARLRLFGNEDLPISRSLEPGAMQKRCCVQAQWEQDAEEPISGPWRGWESWEPQDFVAASSSLVCLGGVIFVGARQCPAWAELLNALGEPGRAVPARSAGSSQPGTEGLISLCSVWSQSQDFNYVFALLAGSQQSHVCSALCGARENAGPDTAGRGHGGCSSKELAVPASGAYPGRFWGFARGHCEPEGGDVSPCVPAAAPLL